jgi:NADPH2:quinone reductase
MFAGHAWQVTSFGEPAEALALRQTTWGEPEEGKILVKVSAAGVSGADLLMVKGLHPAIQQLPIVLGLEASGEVVAVPEGSKFSVGDRVMGMSSFFEGRGGFAEYTYMSEQAQLIPARLDDQQAAGFVLAFRTSYAALVARCGLKSGEYLVVLGAAGDTGAAAIQLGKAIGATVIAVVSSDERGVFCQRLGAEHVINYKQAKVDEEIFHLTQGHGADVVFDVVGGEVAGQALKTMARFGRFAVLGFASGSFVELNPIAMLEGNYSAVGVAADNNWSDEEESVASEFLLARVTQGALTVPALPAISFSDLPEAFAQVEAGTLGKTILRVA